MNERDDTKLVHDESSMVQDAWRGQNANFEPSLGMDNPDIRRTVRKSTRDVVLRSRNYG